MVVEGPIPRWKYCAQCGQKVHDMQWVHCPGCGVKIGEIVAVPADKGSIRAYWHERYSTKPTLIDRLSERVFGW